MGLGMVSLGQFIFPAWDAEGPWEAKFGRLILPAWHADGPGVGENWLWMRGALRPLERYVAPVVICQVRSRIRALGTRVGASGQFLMSAHC